MASRTMVWHRLGQRARDRRVLVVALIVALALCGAADADLSDGIDPSILAPSLLQATQAIERMDRLTAEAEAIGTALFRVHNEFGEHRLRDPAKPPCEAAWLIDLGGRAREFGRAFRDAVQSARVQGLRVESLIVQPTVAPLLDPETNHRVLALLDRIDDLTRRYPEAFAWQQQFVEPLLADCAVIVAPASGFAAPAPEAALDAATGTTPARKREPLVAILAIGGGWLCPGAVPAAGVMLVQGKVCYSASEACSCEPLAVDPATVLGPDTKAGSAN